MDIKKLQALVVDALEDVKAQDIRVYDTTHLTSMFDRIAIASATSNRQTKALASSVRDKVKQAGGDIVNMEGEGTGEWVLVDLGDMVVHIMQPAIRAYYRLEEIWGDKEVSLAVAKRGASARKTTSDASTPAKKAAVKKTVAKKAAPAKTAAKKAPAKKTGTAGAVKTATKTAVKKTAAAKTPARKVTAKAPAKSAVKSAAKPARPATKTAAKKAAPRRTASKD